MGIKDALLGVLNGVTGNVVSGAIDIVKKLVPDKDLQKKLENELYTLQATQDHEQAMAEITLMQGQISVNLEEAKSSSLFVAGWRPAIGWVCGAGIGFAFILKPLIEWGYYIYTGAELIGAPQLNTGELTTLVISMLGLAGLRTSEKMKGVERDTLK